MKRFLIIISIFIICGVALQANNKDDKAIKHALLKYNYGIIKMAKSGETDFFKSFVKKEVVTKLMLWVKSWQDSNLVMLGQIDDFRFFPITYNENNATISTLENWTYSYINIATKEMALEPENIFYEMKYTLQKNNGQWTIIDIKHIREESFKKENIHKPDMVPQEQKPQESLSPQSAQAKIATH